MRILAIAIDHGHGERFGVPQMRYLLQQITRNIHIHVVGDSNRRREYY